MFPFALRLPAHAQNFSKPSGSFGNGGHCICRGSKRSGRLVDSVRLTGGPRICVGPPFAWHRESAAFPSDNSVRPTRTRLRATLDRKRIPAQHLLRIESVQEGK